MTEPLAILEMTAPDPLLTKVKKNLNGGKYTWIEDAADIGAISLWGQNTILLTVYVDVEDYELTLAGEEIF